MVLAYLEVIKESITLITDSVHHNTRLTQPPPAGTASFTDCQTAPFTEPDLLLKATELYLTLRAVDWLLLFSLAHAVILGKLHG